MSDETHPQSLITVERLIDKMQNQSNFPAVSQHIIAINSKAVTSSRSSANELAALILKDYSLSSRLLKVANSAMFGDFSGKISTISRAVVLLGFEQVHLTATGLIFFEQLQDKASSHYIKEGILSSFLSGILARDLAKYYKCAEAEKYFLGAMFHNFGRLLTMYYFPDEYQNYLVFLQKNGSDERAMVQAIGKTFTTLGVGIAKEWCLPEDLVLSMTPPEADELARKDNSITHNQGISAFANELCDISMNVPPTQRLRHLSVLLRKYRELYPLPQETIIAMMDSALIEIKKFSDVLRLNSDDVSNMDKRTFNNLDPDDTLTDEDSINSTRSNLVKLQIIDTPIPQLTNNSTAEERNESLIGGIQEITNVMLEDASLDEILTMILETIYRGIGFDKVIIFFKDSKIEQMKARFSLGSSLKNFLKGFSFTIDSEEPDLFSTSILDGSDLYIPNISDTHIRDLKPEWFRGAIFSPSFVLYPIVVNRKCIGLIYAGHNDTVEELTTQQLNAIKTLRNQAALAIKQERYI